MRRGITLVETMIVISIITILSVVLWLVLGPQAKRGALETEIRSDLRQLSIALQLYMDANDGDRPNWLSKLTTIDAGVPLKPRSVRKFLPECGSGDAKYSLMRPFGIEVKEARYQQTYRFDPSKDAVLKALFYCRVLPGKEEVYSFGGATKQTYKTQIIRVLGSRFDGSIGWVPQVDHWQREYADLAHRSRG